MTSSCTVLVYIYDWRIVVAIKENKKVAHVQHIREAIRRRRRDCLPESFPFKCGESSWFPRDILLLWSPTVAIIHTFMLFPLISPLICPDREQQKSLHFHPFWNSHYRDAALIVVLPFFLPIASPTYPVPCRNDLGSNKTLGRSIQYFPSSFPYSASVFLPIYGKQYPIRRINRKATNGTNFFLCWLAERRTLSLADSIPLNCIIFQPNMFV